MIGKKIIKLSTVDSTNNYVAKLFRSGKISSGTVIMSDIQTNGKGQRGNIWTSEPLVNLTLSFPLDHKTVSVNNLFHINYTVSLAVFDFIKKYCPSTKIKWPNDTYVNGKKIAGILIENQFDNSGFKSSIIGIGININQEYFQNLKATSLYLETNKNYNPSELLLELIESLNKRFDQLKSMRNQVIKDDFDEQLWLKDELHLFEANGLTFEGEIVKTSDDGCLLINTAGGIKSFRNGEIIYLTK